jgi:bisphosphoglycerate-dependent phosphoglycerate mutase
MHDTRKSIYKNKKKPHGTKKVGANEVGTKEVGTKEVGTKEVGTKEVGTKKVTFNLDIKKTNNRDKRTRRRGAQHKHIIKNNTRKVAEGGNNTVKEDCSKLENTLNDYKKDNDNCSKSKYNAVAVQLHPDKNPDCDEKSTALFQELNQFKKDGCKSKIKGKKTNPINGITTDIEYIISSDKKTITYEGKTLPIKKMETKDGKVIITLRSGVTIVSDGDRSVRSVSTISTTTPLAPAQQEAKRVEANELPEAKHDEENSLPEEKRVEALAHGDNGVSPAQPEKEIPLFSSIIFQTKDGKTDEEVKKYLIEKMDIDIKKAEDDIKQTLASFHEKCQKDPSLNWTDCNGDCNAVATKYIKKEINSTAYILNTLAQSMLSTASSKPTLTIELYVNLENLTGQWEDDNKNVKIISYGDNTQSKSKDARLVMGFGPSSSGKTFLSKTVLQLLTSNGTFPETFFSIDGGIYRETSTVYSAIVRIAKEYACVAGFTNLAGGMFMMFKSGSIKKVITSFLKKQKEIVNISLYVPETLGDCILCADKYKPYLDITGDSKWIGLLIWQHKYGNDCIYTDKYKCKGCTESGTEREIKEGKKYSNRAWERSMKYGMEEMMKAPGGRFKIHNSGQVGHLSIIENYSDIETSNKIRKVFRENEKDVYSYVDKSVVDNKTLVDNKSQAQDIEFDKTKTKKVNIYYIRHGYSCANYERDTKWLPGAQKFVVDPTLHCKGILQAEKVGEDFNNSGLTIDRICTSQLLRAIQTGLLIRNNLNEKDKKIPFQIVRHMSEKGGKWSPFDYDNIPEHVKLINSKDQAQFLEDNKIVMDNDTTQKSEYEKYINIILPQMVLSSIQKENKDEYNFIFVSHSSLLNKMYGTKLDNGQSIIRHYIFTNNGLMIQETPETPQDDAFKKDKLSSAYSKEYPFNKKIENCNICSNKISLDNITELLNPDKLHTWTMQGAANIERSASAQIGKQKINGFILNEAGESEPAEFMIDISKSHSVSIGSEKYKIKNIYKKDTDIIVETDSKKFKIPYNEENSHYERLYIDNWYFLLREEIGTRRRAIEYIKDGKTYTQFIYDNGNNRGDVTKINKDIPSIENENLKIISTRVGVNSHFYQLWDDEYKNAIKNNNIPEFNETEQKAIDALKDEVNKEVVYETILTKEQIDDIRQGKPLPIEKEIEEYFIQGRGHPVNPDKGEVEPSSVPDEIVQGEASASVDSDDDDSSTPDKKQSEPSGSVQGEASAPVDSSNSSGANGVSPYEDDEDWEKIETSESIINNIIYTPYGFELLIDLTKF